MCRKEVSRETVRNSDNLSERYYINQIAEFSHCLIAIPFIALDIFEKGMLE